MKRILIPLALLLSAIVGSAFAYPRLSVEQSTTCKSCHINPNGGGMRNEYGNYAVALNELTLPATKKTAVENYRSPRLSDAVTIGFDTRHLVLDDGYIFRMQTDLFVNIEPFKDFYYNIRLWENGINENYALMYFSQKKSYLKVGRFYPSFGLHNSDHKTYNRERTGHGSNLYLDGLALGTSINGLELSAEIFNQNNRGVYGFHLMRSRVFHSIKIFGGASFRLSEEINGSNGTFPHAKSIFGGVSYDRFTLMGELDLVGQSNDTLITYLNLTTRLEYGLYLIGEYNFFDGNRDISDGVDEFVRISVELYPISFFQLRPSYTYYTNGILKDESDYFVMIHFGY